MTNLTLVSQICHTLQTNRLLDETFANHAVTESDVRESVTAVLNSLDEKDQLHTLRLTNALLKNDIISDKSETMECLKPILSSFRDTLKNSAEPSIEADSYDTEEDNDSDGTEGEGTVIMTSKSDVRVFTDIPMPTARRAGGKYPWETVAQGHSFFVPGASIKSWYTQTNKKNKEMKPKKFIAREYVLQEAEGEAVEGVMVWRTE